MGPLKWFRIVFYRHYLLAIGKAVVKLNDQGRYDEAVPMAEHAIQFAESRLGEGDFFFAVALNNLGLLHAARADYAAAESLFHRALEIVRPRLAAGYPLFSTSLPILGRLMAFLCSCFVVGPLYGKYFPLLCRTTESMGTQLNAGYFFYGTIVNNLAELNRLQGRYPSAESYSREAMDVIRSRFGLGHSFYITVLQNSALLSASMGRFSTAEELSKSAVELAGRRLGVGRPLYSRGLSYLRPALEIIGMRPEADSLHYIFALNNLAEIYRLLGKYREAEPHFREALKIADNRLRAGHPVRGTILGNLALLRSDMGDYRSAESLLVSANENDRAALGETHPSYATGLSNLALLYHSQGFYIAAEGLFQRALEIRQAALGEGHPDLATSLHNLAALYESQGKYDKAEPLYLRALEIRRTAVGENHTSYASTMRMLASLYESTDRYDEAEPLYVRALEIDRVALGERHPEFASDLNNLAGLRRSQGDNESAEPLYRRALEIKRDALGVNHPSYAGGLNNLASLLAATGRAGEAREMMMEAAAINDRMIGQMFSMGSEAQRAAFLETMRGDLDAFLSLVLTYEAESAAAVRSALDLILRRKAIEADASAIQRQAVLGGKYPELLPLLEEVSVLSNQIAQMALAGPGPEGLVSHHGRMAYWRGRRDVAESKLARLIPEMNLEHNFRSADRRAVALSVPEGVALIEFVRFQVYDFHAVRARGQSSWKPAHYVAFVLFQGDPEQVRMVDLKEAEPIDQMIADFRAIVAGGPEDRLGRAMTLRTPTPNAIVVRDLGEALRAAIFDKLVPALAGRTRLMISPDGDLYRVPFEILPRAGGRLVVDDGFEVDYVNCGRDVLRFGAASTGRPADAIVAADPDYDFDGTNSSAPSNPEPTAGLRVRDMANLKFPAHRLRASRVEGERVAERLGVQPWLGSTVLEGRLRKECRSPWILHLATHGFFREDQPRNPPHEVRDTAEPGGIRRLAGPLPENPLLRAGLLLAGANTWYETGRFDDRAEDGLLMAEDVTGLDLLATELVVLSACETGLGEVRTGEGVFGLQRAFVLAGAKTLVMSLWAVHDLSTAILMDRFYENLLDRRLGRSEALRQAQSFVRNLTVGALRATWLAPEMIERLAAGDADFRERLAQITLDSDDYLPFNDPYYWGAFICQGDPSPLESPTRGGEMDPPKPCVSAPAVAC